MDWFLYDRELRHERAKTVFYVNLVLFLIIEFYDYDRLRYWNKYF